MPFALDDALRALADVAGPHVATRDLEQVFAPSPALPETLVGDSLHLRQVLVNLVGNAAKFTAYGTIVVNIEPVLRIADDILRSRYATPASASARNSRRVCSSPSPRPIRRPRASTAAAASGSPFRAVWSN